MIPRRHILPVIFVMGWTYLNYYEPLFLPLGLVVLILYAKRDIIGRWFRDRQKGEDFTKNQGKS